MFDGTYGDYVLAAYVFAAIVLFALIWSTVSASRRARHDLQQTGRERSTK